MSVFEYTAFASTILLPPGSTSDDLQAAVDSSTPGDTIEIESDIFFTSSVAIPAGKEVTIQSTAGNDWTLTQTAAAAHFTVAGALILQNITLDGGGTGGKIEVGGSLTLNSGAVIQNCTSFNGGGVAVSGGTITINSGAVIQNCTTGNAGGGVYVSGGTLSVNGGSIRNNQSGHGGAIYARESNFFISNALITDNVAIGHGGGVHIDGCISPVNIDGNEFRGNTAGRGGGIYIINTNTAISDNRIIGNSASRDGGGIFDWQGTFSIDNSDISDNSAGDSGAGIFTIYSSFTVNTSTISGNKADVYGGGVYNYGGTVNIADDEVIGNAAGELGGGVFTMYSDLTIAGSTINGNTTTGSGGGAYNFYSTVTINGSEIFGNTAVEYGGGIADEGSNIKISDAVIDDNIAADEDGGGIYLAADSTLEIAGTSRITNNSAPNGNGGGIFTEDMTYVNLITDGATVFTGNTASKAYQPPANATTLYPNIGFSSTSITNHPLNNYDINYINGEFLIYQVTYNANGGTGSHVDIDLPDGSQYTIKSPGATGISRPGYTFTGWNTQPDGSGISYEPGTRITVTGDVTLYAQWAQDDPMYTVTYNANGGTGSHVDTNIPGGSQYTIKSPGATGISRPGYTFTGWNTQPDGSGISYEPGTIITITGDLTLYAQWKPDDKPCWVPCCIVCCRQCYNPCCNPCCRPRCSSCCNTFKKCIK